MEENEIFGRSSLYGLGSLAVERKLMLKSIGILLIFDYNSNTVINERIHWKNIICE